MAVRMNALAEFHAALLQAAVTAGVAALGWYLFAKYRRRYLLWWSLAWSLYALRIVAIVAFLSTSAEPWLFAHQILTAWTALALLWAALTFSDAARWRSWYLMVLVFPVLWSWVAIYSLHSFLLAAGPAVLFLSFATAWTGWIFVRQWRRSGSRGALVLALVLFSWALHHLDYPILRARGAWDPWGYYLDIVFTLSMGIGIVILAFEALDHRTTELERLSSRMVEQHEEERRRVSRELHDQTAQVWTAVRMQLGLIHEAAPPALGPRFERVLALVDEGIQSIRTVTTNLRPPLLDDLGLGPALRALAQSFAQESGLTVLFEAPAAFPPVSDEASLALFRALQEALSNVARHSGATSADVRVSVSNGELMLEVRDNGRGFSPAGIQSPSSLGLSGMRERVTALRGSVSLNTGAGAVITIRLPLAEVS
jgi:signal transduction histidine kinase